MKIIRNILQEANVEGGDLQGGVDYAANEAEALAGLSNPQVNETQTEQTEVTPGSQNETPDDNDIDLEGIDLSFLGINTEPQENQVQEAKEEHQTQPNQMDEIKELISNMSNSQNQQQNTPSMPEEEVAAVTELFDKFKQLGLIPENNGLSDEDKALLENAKSINEKLQNNEAEQKAFAEHQGKLSSLDDFSKKLETSIQGYSTEFMQKVVGDINKTNPEAAQKIFNNPALLIDLWNSVGAKAQPQTQQSGVIGSGGQQSSNFNNLDEKVKNGTATEQEEAQWLRDA